MKVFDELAAEQWSSNPDLIPDDCKAILKQNLGDDADFTRLKYTDIAEMRSTGKFTWHECEDTYSAILVKTEIHAFVSHYGGVEIVNNMTNTQIKQRIKDMTEFLRSKGMGR